MYSASIFRTLEQTDPCRLLLDFFGTPIRSVIESPGLLFPVLASRIRLQGMPLVEELERHCLAAEARAAQDEESERQKQTATLTALAVAMMAEQDDAVDSAVDDGSDNTPLPGSTFITVEQNQSSSAPLSTRDANAHSARRSLTLESRRSSFKAVNEAARLKRQEQRDITEALNLLIKQTLRNCYTQGPLFILLMAWPLLRTSLALVLPLILSGASAAIFSIIRSLPSRLTAPSALVRATGATADADGRSGSTAAASRVRLRSESAARASMDLSQLSMSASASASVSASVAPAPESMAGAENLVGPSGL